MDFRGIQHGGKKRPVWMSCFFRPSIYTYFRKPLSLIRGVQ
jgi:hypothetical protein